MKHRNKNLKSNFLYTLLCHVFNFINDNSNTWLMNLTLLIAFLLNLFVSIQKSNLYKSQIESLRNHIEYLELHNHVLKNDCQNAGKQ